MTTARESRTQLNAVTGEALAVSLDLLERVQGAPTVQRAALLEGIPEIVAYYSLGSAALAADFYDEARERAGVTRAFATEPVVLDRTVKVRRAVAWASEPLFVAGAGLLAVSRFEEVVQLEVARPYRDTILTNRRSDPESVGWRRITAGGCKFCRMLADKGAIYKHDTARFAAHPSCHCTAEPVFKTNDTGVEASVMQYVASKRQRTAEEKARLRDHLNEFFPDSPG